VACRAERGRVVRYANSMREILNPVGPRCLHIWPQVVIIVRDTLGPIAPAAGGIARFYLVTSEGGQGTSYNTLAECLEGRAKAAQTAICVNR
jgi:hypothetical protein